jgi:hypothetical protein
MGESEGKMRFVIFFCCFYSRCIRRLVVFCFVLPSTHLIYTDTDTDMTLSLLFLCSESQRIHRGPEEDASCMRDRVVTACNERPDDDGVVMYIE